MGSTFSWPQISFLIRIIQAIPSILGTSKTYIYNQPKFCKMEGKTCFSLIIYFWFFCIMYNRGSFFRDVFDVEQSHVENDFVMFPLFSKSSISSR